jgi:hypothetical protein
MKLYQLVHAATDENKTLVMIGTDYIYRGGLASN